jgi:ribose transport system permease protein
MSTPTQENKTAPPAVAESAEQVAARLRLQSRLRELLPAALLVVILVTFSILSPAYFSISNFSNIADQSAVLIIAAMGLTLVILAGSIDLSIGSVAGMAAVVTASFATGGSLSNAAPFSMNIGLFAVLIGVALGALVGLFNGAVFSLLRVPSFVVTLGVLTLGAGLQIVWTSGQPISIQSEAILHFGIESLLGVPLSFWVALVCVAICMMIAQFTTFGRHVYALGGSERVAEMSAVPTTRVKIAIFMLSGMFAALAGVLDAARNASGTPTAGSGLELTAIAAVVIGGTPLTGGTGGPFGTLIGALIITSLNAGLNILGVPPQWSPVITGGVLIVAVIISIDRRRIGVIK